MKQAKKDWNIRMKYRYNYSKPKVKKEFWHQCNSIIISARIKTEREGIQNIPRFLFISIHQSKHYTFFTSSPLSGTSTSGGGCSLTEKGSKL